MQQRPSHLRQKAKRLVGSCVIRTAADSVQRQPLRTRAEICANAVWRFLQLRGYVDRHHQLTAWGKVLDSILSIAGPQPQQEKAALLAVELMRFGLLNADTMFSAYSGAPSRSNGQSSSIHV